MQLFHASCQKKSRVCLHRSVILLFLTDYNDYANPLVCVFFIALTPIWILIARRIPSTREVLYSGWEPVIIAMAISRYNKEIFSHLSAFISNNRKIPKIISIVFFQCWRPHPGQNCVQSQLCWNGGVYASHQW